jgi:hypothetical protein
VNPRASRELTLREKVFDPPSSKIFGKAHEDLSLDLLFQCYQKARLLLEC